VLQPVSHVDGSASQSASLARPQKRGKGLSALARDENAASGVEGRRGAALICGLVHYAR
jgi:hypothetical protein